MAKKQRRELNLHLNTLRFEPYTEVKNVHNTQSILKAVFEYLREERQNGRGHLIDKHKNQDKAESREIYMVSHRNLHNERRIRCSMAYLRKGKRPKLKPTNKLKLVPLSSIGGDIAEVTHFFVDYSGTRCIICAEFNHNGPRLHDFEFYLRQIAGKNHLKLARATEVTALFSSNIDETLATLQNVLQMNVKLKPADLRLMDSDVRQNYFSDMENIGKVFKPKFFRIKTYFQIPGSNTPVGVNHEANNWFTGILSIFKTRSRNKKFFENFEVKYEDIHGVENIFNLSKNRETIIIPIGANDEFKNKALYELVKADLDQFISSFYADN